MNRELIIPGTRFHKLVCLQFVGRDHKSRQRYLWRCDCGTEKVIGAYNIKTGSTKSCGCYRKDGAHLVRVSTKEVCCNGKYLTYKDRAVRSNLPFTLTYTEFSHLILAACEYCGSTGRNCFKVKSHEDFYYNGIDRVDNSKGYTLENCVTCCFICNRAKSTMTRESFLTWIKEICTKSMPEGGNERE